ncbi:hypothetical protein Droror1_Dr00027358 [Drosera rotundifolia]
MQQAKERAGDKSESRYCGIVFHYSFSFSSSFSALGYGGIEKQRDEAVVVALETLPVIELGGATLVGRLGHGLPIFDLKMLRAELGPAFDSWNLEKIGEVLADECDN